MQIELNLGFISFPTGSYTQPFDKGVTLENCQEHFDSEEKLLRMCKVSLEDETGHGSFGSDGPQLASAWKVLENIDGLSDTLHLRDMVMAIATKMFQEGMAYQAELEASKPITIVP